MPIDIRPGDVLLHMGTADISKLIAWAGNGIYSHAAIVLDGTTIAEASAQGIRTYSLQTRLQQTSDYDFIDVFRFNTELSGAQLDSVFTVANGYMGVPYALNDLAFLGLLCAFRSKVPESPAARLLVRIALDLAIGSDAKSLTCSEFVYRCFSEARTTPPDALRPKIVIQERAELPFPDINWFALWKELEEAKKSQPAAASNASLETASASLQTLASRADNSVISDDELLSKAATLRDWLGSRATPPLMGTADAANGPLIDPMPNPKTVEPGDLMASPSFVRGQRVLPANATGA